MSLAHIVARLSAIAPDLLSVMLEATVKGGAIIAIVALLALAMRRASAAARHLVWFLGVLSLLLLPALSAALPHWRILPVPAVKQARPQPEDVADAPHSAPAEPVAQSAPPQKQPTMKAEPPPADVSTTIRGNLAPPCRRRYRPDRLRRPRRRRDRHCWLE